MALGEFISEFGDATDSSSWADDEMPSVAAVPEDLWSGGGSSSGWGGRPTRMMRETVPVPNSPPYTARLISLPYDIDEGAISQFFVDQGLAVSSVRLPKDVEAGRIRGYGFVEFEDRESLVQALGCEGKMLGGRALRVAVAENRMGGDRDRTDDDWRSGRRGPLPPLEHGGRGGGFGRRTGGFDEPDLDWSARREPREREPREFRGGERGGERGGFGGGFGGRGPRPPRDEPELDWSSRREPAFSRPPRANRPPRAAEPDLDWSVRKTLPELPAKARGQNQGQQSRRNDGRTRNLEEWGRAAPAAATAGTPAATTSGTKDTTKGFAVLSTDDEPQASASATPAAAVKSTPAVPATAETAAAAPTEQPTQGSWSVTSSGRH